MTPLAEYGYGPARLKTFEKNTTEHEKQRNARPEIMAAKKQNVQFKRGAVRASWIWVEMVFSSLSVAAESNAEIATALEEATPKTDAELLVKLPAMGKLLVTHKDKLEKEAKVDERLAAIDGLCQALRTAPGAAHSAKSATVSDTAAIDVLDGKLITMISGLNKAARKAIRAGRLSARLSEYRYQVLTKTGRTGHVTDSEGDADPAASHDA